MPTKRKKNTKTKTVETLTHPDDKRPNIPTAELQPVMEDDAPVPVTYERNRDLDPQFVWRGKDQQDWSDLVVQAPPLFIQEKVHPKVLVDDLMRGSQSDNGTPQEQLDLFADFNGLPSEEAKTEFYQHNANWSNRMILGDSLRVMASLAEREGLRGKVQCIYVDPPYGIKFNSNFQWSTTSRTVKDGKVDHITREPEQVKAFRDTWRDGIHSYLTYLRDRLVAARDLLTESGSIFVQIGDENVHRVRGLMDEVFGEENSVATICYASSIGLGGKLLDTVTNHIIWYSKSKGSVKYRPLFRELTRGSAGAARYNSITDNTFQDRRLTKQESVDSSSIDDNMCFFRQGLTSRSGGESTQYPVLFAGKSYYPTAGGWRTGTIGMARVVKASRVALEGNRLTFKKYFGDFGFMSISNFWRDVTGGVASRTDPKVYVVQTSTKIIERCILMATDPGDLVLDPTCGSGTTAYVAEGWGRRWITIDTSRVALALARARLMGARYDYYLLSDSREGKLKEAEIEGKAPSETPTYGDIRQGFVYERVPHITLKSIANNAEIDVIWERYEEELAPLRAELSEVCGLPETLEEWEVPRERPDDWPPDAEPLLADFWERRIARQKEIDVSIADKAEDEYLFDKPYEDKEKVRVAGPFTVESLSPHRVLGVDEDDELIKNLADAELGYGETQDFAGMILDQLKTSGVQQTHKEDRISFTSLEPRHGALVCAEGRYVEGDPDSGEEKRAGIFIGPEFGTVSRPDLIEAAREAADADFELLIACAFSYEAHSTDLQKLGKIPILKATMNADLHMAADLSNTGKGNLFVIFGEPDITVASGLWLVTSKGEKFANYEQVKELSRLGSLEEINRIGRDGLSHICSVSTGREVRHNQPSAEIGGIGAGEYSGGIGTPADRGVPTISGNSERLPSGDGDISDSGAAVGDSQRRTNQSPTRSGGGHWTDAQRSQTLAAIQNLTDADFPLALTTGHWTQVTVLGVDVFHPSTGEIRSDNADGIACWFIDTDYNAESFFVRHAYFLGANDPYKSLKTTLKAEINREAWETLHSDTSRPFEKPKSGRIAVKVINHLGDEVMKVFRV